jgi:hypothetical protein
MMHPTDVSHAFLDEFIGNNDEVKKRCLSSLDFGENWAMKTTMYLSTTSTIEA